jgi:hypothetical protein
VALDRYHRDQARHQQPAALPSSHPPPDRQGAEGGG